VSEKTQFVLLGSLGCHLCEVAEAMLVQTLSPELHCLDYIDIAYDDDLLEKYGQHIPVLMNEKNGQELAWPFDLTELQLFINKSPVSV
jgi:hypothetical protein